MMKRIVLSVCAAVAAAVVAFADGDASTGTPVVWTGDGGDGKWTTPENWNPVCVPGPTSCVTIASGTVTISSPAHVQNLVIGDGVTAVGVTVQANLVVDDSLDVLAKVTLTADSPISVGNDVRLRSGATVTHTGPNSKELYRVDIAAGGDVTVEASATINVSENGYTYQKGPGYSSSMASHGGSPPEHPNMCYGCLSAPTNYGSGGSNWRRGGGAVKLFAGGLMQLDGTITANGQEGGSQYETGAGGSIWLKAAELRGAGTVSARGGDSTNAKSPWSGGGGRVAVWLSQATDLSAWNGKITARGGTPVGGPGTVYEQFAGQTQTNATVILDNGGRAVGYVELGAKLGSDFVGTLVITNGACVRMLDSTLTVYGDLIVPSKGSFVEPAGKSIVLAGSNPKRISGAMGLPGVSCTIPGMSLIFGTGSSDCFTIAEEGRLTLIGNGEWPISLTGDPAESEWAMCLKPSVKTDIQNVAVSNSNARTGLPVLAIDSQDLGGNDNWGFSPRIVPGERISWTGKNGTSYADTGNWLTASGGHRAPQDTDHVVIPAGCENMPVLRDGETLFNILEIEADARLELVNCRVIVTNALTVSGTLMATGGERITCRGDLTLRGGTFVQAQSVVRFDGAAEQTVSMNENQAFYRLEIEKSGGGVTFDEGFSAHVCDWRTENAVTLSFAGGKAVVADEFLCRGRQGTAATTAALTLTGVAPWRLQVGEVQFVSGVRAVRSQATGAAVNADVRSSDGGGNTGWDFSAKAAEWTGKANTKAFATAGNWYPEVKPDGLTHALVSARTGESLSLEVSSAESVSNFIFGTTGANVGTTSISATKALTVCGDWLVGTNATLTLDCATDDNRVAGSMRIASGSTLTHTRSGGTTKIRIVIGGDFALAGGATVDANEKCTITTYPAYGGTTKDHESSCYGSFCEPADAGRGIQYWYGGGAVKILADGELRIDGTITAVGGASTGWETGSGGGIWLKGTRLVGTGKLIARGGDTGNTGSTSNTGSGGRMAVLLSEEDGLSGWEGTMTVRGGTPIGGAGTLYVETGTAATLTLDNTGRGNNSYPTYGLTPLAFSMGPDTKDKWRQISMVIGTRAYVVLQDDLHVNDIDIQSKVAGIDLRGHTLTVHGSRHRGGRGWAGKYEDLVTENGGKIIWKGGMALIIR